MERASANRMTLIERGERKRRERERERERRERERARRAGEMKNIWR